MKGTFCHQLDTQLSNLTQELAEKYSWTSTLYTACAVAHMKMGQYEEAERELNEALTKVLSLYKKYFPILKIRVNFETLEIFLPFTSLSSSLSPTENLQDISLHILMRICAMSN